MIVIRTCWYLCIIFLATFVCTSAITVVPDKENEVAIIMRIFLILSILAGIAGLLLRIYFKNHPEAVIFKSKVVSRFCIGISIALTLIFLLFVVG